MAAVHRALSADGGGLLDGRDTRGDRALPSHGGNGSERLCRRPVETLRRRHRARPAAVEERGFQSHFALERSVSVRPAAAILYRVLQRHIQRRRESHRNSHRPVPAAAQRGPRAAPSDRAKLRASAGDARDRQPDTRGHCSIQCRTGLFDGTTGNPGQNPQPCEARLSEKMMEHEDDEESYRVPLRDIFILYDILVTGIELPAAIVAAINRKTEQYYIAEEYKFRVEREKRESE